MDAICLISSAVPADPRSDTINRPGACVAGSAMVYRLWGNIKCQPTTDTLLDGYARHANRAPCTSAIEVLEASRRPGRRMVSSSLDYATTVRVESRHHHLVPRQVVSV